MLPDPSPPVGNGRSPVGESPAPDGDAGIGMGAMSGGDESQRTKHGIGMNRTRGLKVTFVTLRALLTSKLFVHM